MSIKKPYRMDVFQELETLAWIRYLQVKYPQDRDTNGRFVGGGGDSGSGGIGGGVAPKPSGGISKPSGVGNRGRHLGTGRFTSNKPGGNKPTGKPTVVPGSPQDTNATQEQRNTYWASYMGQQFPNTQFDFTGMNSQVTAQVVAQYTSLTAQYPGVSSAIPYLGVASNAPAEMVAKGYVVDYAANPNSMANTVMSHIGNTPISPIFLNTSVFADNQKLTNMVQRDANSGWFAKGGANVDGATYTITHEFGHVLNNYLDNARGILAPGSSEQTIHDTWRSFQMNNPPSTSNVSKYGNANRFEAFAEGFASTQFDSSSQQGQYAQNLSTYLSATFPPKKTLREAILVVIKDDEQQPLPDELPKPDWVEEGGMHFSPETVAELEQEQAEKKKQRRQKNRRHR